MSILALTFVLALSPVDENKPAANPKHVSIDLLFDMEATANPRVSPDGKQVVFTRTWSDRVNDRPRSELWIMDQDGSRLRQLGAGSSPEWSPDGTRIAYLADGQPAGSQIWWMWVATRESTQITRIDRAPTDLRWSPDGKRIAFRSVVPEKNDVLPISMPRRPEGAKWAEDATIITRLDYRRDREGYRPSGFQHLFVVDAEGGTPRQVTSGDFDHGAGEWTADGKSLVFDGLREADADWRPFDSEIYAIDVESGAVTDLTNRKGSESAPHVSPDGKWIAYLAAPDHEVGHHSYDVSTLMVMGADGSNPRALSATLDRDPVDVAWSHDSSTVWFTIDASGERQLWTMPVDPSRPSTMEPTRVTSGTHKFTLGDVDANGVAWGVVTAPHVPGDIARVDARAGGDRAPTLLTHVNDDVLARLDLAPVEELKWKSADGLEVEGWVVKPPDFDALTANGKRLPLVLQIHGGPHAMYGVEWSFERQWFAAQGYVVLYVNPRGSTGYGQEFGNAIQNAYPGKDYDDLMSGVDTVIAKLPIDDKRLFVYGGSGGGVLTAWIVGHTSRFAAAVSMFPVIDWVSFVGTTDGPWWYANFKKLPWEDVTEHWDRSPLKYVGNVTTPTLLITGELDLRTPIAQTEEYYQALKLRKVDTAMIRIPDEYHGAAGRHVSNAARRILYVESWFAKHAPKPAPQPEKAADPGAGSR